jgi:hypothetical protein
VNVSAIRNPGRVAGLLYLLLMVAPFRLIYIPNKLFVSGDATATAHNIAAHEMMFRLGIVTDLFCGVVLIFLTLALYRLFAGVNRNAAVLVVILGGVLPSVIDFINSANDGAALLLIRGADYLSVFAEAQRYAMAYFFTRLHHQVIAGAEILWGLWLLPLGFLTYKSGFMPRFIGVWLYINGVTYVVISFTALLLPKYESKVLTLRSLRSWVRSRSCCGSSSVARHAAAGARRCGEQRVVPCVRR